MNEHQDMKSYHADVRDLWLKLVPAMATMNAIVVFGVMWIMVKLIGIPPLGMDWRIVATIISIVLAILPIKIMYPERPTADLIEDQASFIEK